MKSLIAICAFVLLILNAHPGFSQEEIEVSGKKYLLHEVKKGETAYGLCVRYQVTQAELTQANPDITAVLKSGTTIRIPVKKAQSAPVVDQAKPQAVVAEPQYYYHKVFKNQTILSIARQYGITADALVKYNPELASGLIPGQVLKIPVKIPDTTVASAHPKTLYEGSAVTTQAAPSEAHYTIHTVTAGETIYRLEQKYGVTREELLQLNPALASGLQTGARLRIPQVEKQEATKTAAVPSVQDSAPAAAALGQDHAPVDCQPIVGKNSEKYKVALLLPFYLHGNDYTQLTKPDTQRLLSPIDFSQLSNQWITGNSDSVASPGTVTIDPKAESFLEFYEGVLLAVDSMQRQGMNIELLVFDASNKNMINGLLQLDVFRSLNLIIGPVYPELQETVASFAAKNRIPMVSPLANTGTFEENNPYYFKVNPTKEYQVELTARYIAGEFSDNKFILLSMPGNANSTEARIAELGKAKLMSENHGNGGRRNLFHEYSFQKQGLHGVKELMDATGENIFMIPSDNEAQVSVAVTNLNALAENYNVVLMGTSNFPKLKSIQTENYHRVRLRYLSPTFVDYNKPLVHRFISHYRSAFSAEPTQFSYQGFDVSYYFMSALFRYGKDFRNCLPEYPMELTQTNFSFRKVTPMGGYMNHSLFVTSFERSFDIMNLGSIVAEP